MGDGGMGCLSPLWTYFCEWVGLSHGGGVRCLGPSVSGWGYHMGLGSCKVPEVITRGVEGGESCEVLGYTVHRFSGALRWVL